MKMIALPSQEFLRARFIYDPDTGVFYNRVRIAANAMPGQVAGTTMANGYVAIAIHKRKYLAHRLAWMYEKGGDPMIEVDHKNRVRSDNRIDNLRPSGMKGNSGNIGLSSHNTSGLKGVRWDKERRKWAAAIKIDGRKTFLGRYSDVEDAISAYDTAALDHFGECALTNREIAHGQH